MKQVRLCLSGSGYRFPAHIGAVAAVEEAGYEIVEVAGTSGGSIVAAMVAKGYSAKELLDMTLSTDFSRFIEFNFSALPSFSWCNAERLRKFLATLLGEHTTFSELKIPAHIVASDIRKSEMYVFNKPEENVVSAVRASSAVPFLYAPIKYNGMWCVDGGVCSNTPVELLQDDQILKLGVKLTSDIDTTPVDSLLDIIGRTANLLFENNDRWHVDYERMQGALFSFVNTGTLGSFDVKASKETRQQLYDYGYEKTKAVLAEYEKSLKGKRGFGEIDYGKINSKLYGK